MTIDSSNPDAIQETITSLIASISKTDLMTVKCNIANRKLSLALDSGACANIISYKSLISLQHKLNRTWELKPVDVTLSGVTGNNIKLLGMVTLPIRFNKHGFAPINCRFYVTNHFPIAADGLLGIHTLSNMGISLHTHQNTVECQGSKFQIMTNPRPLLQNTIADTALIPTVLGTESVESQDSRNVDDDNISPIIVTKTKQISAQGWTTVDVKIPNCAEGKDVISLSETIKHKRLSLESTLSTSQVDGKTKILVCNQTNAPITLKTGCKIGDALVYNNPVDPNPPELLLNQTLISTVLESVSDGNTCENTQSILKQHIKQTDYPEINNELVKILSSYRDVIALPGEPLGRTQLTKHTINLKTGTIPIYTQAYRLPHFQRQIVDNMVEDMMQQGVIQNSNSAYNAPLFLVPKKDGGWRPVIDYRRLNALTIPDRYPMPVLAELLQGIGRGNTIFSSLDFLSGYWQIEMSEESRHLTAFSTPKGHYEFLRMPFGLSNAPLTFQRLMNNLFAGILGRSVHIYMDDLIICSKDAESHLLKLKEVLDRLRSAGLKLKLTKCNFCRSKIKFLGHEIDAEGIHTLKDKTIAIQNFPQPNTVENVRSFIGLSGYYRKFIKDFASIAKPLTSLLKKETKFEWGPAQEKSFSELKRALTNPPVLVFPDYTQPFQLYTDASGKGLGAVLTQPDENGRMRVIAYASRVLNDAESKYSTFEWETLAVAWALRHFRDIIFNYTIEVYTDNEAVSKVFKGGKNLSGRLARWYETVIQFNPKLFHVRGKSNVVADALSRNTVNPICSVPAMQNDQLKDEQRKDPYWAKIIYYLESGDDTMLPSMPFPVTQCKLRDDILVRQLPIKETNDSCFKIIIPDTLIHVVLQQHHDAPQAGHPGRDKTLHQIRNKFFWNKMRVDVINHVSNCKSCAQHKGTTGKPAPIQAYPSVSKPFETISMDLLKMPKSHQGSVYILVMVDFLSRFTVLAPLKSKNADEVAHAFLNNLILPFTTPNTILTDNGLEFANKVIANICQYYSIKQSFISPYHPSSNGLVERVNRTVLSVLRHVTEQLDANWEDWLPSVASCINGSIISSTRKTPFYVVYGTDKTLPYELLQQPQEPVYNLEDYAKRQIQVLKRIHQEVRKTLDASRAEMIKVQHSRAKPVTLQKGDKVMLLDPVKESKLAPKFKGPYVVQEKIHGNKCIIMDPTTGTMDSVHVDRLKHVSSSISIEPSNSTDQNMSDTQPSTSRDEETVSNAYKAKLRSASKLQ